uniref:Transposase n=1 Tax=Romanomermis culicivorax TaxID=13658 RepID=A0A915I1B0_ROMCU
MYNIFAALENEMSLNKVQFLHDLCDIHINRAIKSWVGVGKSEGCRVQKISNSNRWRSTWARSPELVKKICELIPAQFERIDNEFDDNSILVEGTDGNIEKNENQQQGSQLENSKDDDEKNMKEKWHCWTKKYQMTSLFENRMQALEPEIRASQAKTLYYEHLSQKMQNEQQQGANSSSFYESHPGNGNFTSL